MKHFALIVLLFYVVLAGFHCQRNSDIATGPAQGESDQKPLVKSAIPVVTAGTDPDAVLQAAARFRNFNGTAGDEFWQGELPLSDQSCAVDFSATPTSDGTVVVGSWLASNHVEIVFDAATQKLVTTITSSHEFTNSCTVGDLGGLNYIEFEIAWKYAATVNFENVTLDGHALGSFQSSGLMGVLNFMIKDYVVTGGFVLEGDIVLAGAQAGGDQCRVQVSVGLLGDIGPANQPPDCSNARPDKASLWPANRKFVPVTILGITDPDGDPVSVTVNRIYQDEPVDYGTSGRYAPDAYGIGTATAHVRTERTFKGNGRVYHIYYTANDDKGAYCSGQVLVSVPMKKGEQSVDDGPVYNSVLK
ncbi:hypothetical protein JW935_21435 [candidate division KSB1 bacterium]|nr:hypothetical protein [candidate division KSB1 bacterium]